MDAHGFDEVLLETVGVGQAEYAVRNQVDSLVLVLLPDTPTAGAQEMAEQLRLAVEQASFVWLQASVPITVSIGVATWSGGTFQASALVASADGALYQAKNSGRNRVCVADNALHLAVPDTHTAEAIRA